MRRALLGAAASVLTLVLAGAAPAHGPYAPPPPVVGVRAHYTAHAVPFRGGYYYQGRQHHWSQRVWDAHYHRYHYYDPSLRCYYYWYPAGNCYYPVDYTPF